MYFFTGRPFGLAAIGGLDREDGDLIFPGERYANEVLELALAHTVSDKVETAYRRGDQLAKRHALMADWSAFCVGA
jgi:hypothetical protein